MNLLRHRAGAHEGRERLFDVVEAIANFLFSLGADSLFRRRIVEHAGGCLDHEIVMADDIGR